MNVPQLWQKWLTISAQTGARVSSFCHGIEAGAALGGVDAATYARSSGVQSGSSAGFEAAPFSQTSHQTTPSAPKT